MGDPELPLRRQAIEHYQRGENPGAICALLKRSRRWFYKWLRRYQSEGWEGLHGRSHRPRQPSPQLPQTVVTDNGDRSIFSRSCG